MRIRWRKTTYRGLKHERKPFSKKIVMGANCEYSWSSMVYPGVEVWEEEMFHTYEPVMAVFRRRILELGKIKRLAINYQKKLIEPF